MLDENNTNFTYNNIKITYDIEKFIIKLIDGNNNFNIKKIRKYIKTKFKNETQIL